MATKKHAAPGVSRREALQVSPRILNEMLEILRDGYAVRREIDEAQKARLSKLILKLSPPQDLSDRAQTAHPSEKMPSLASLLWNRVRVAGPETKIKLTLSLTLTVLSCTLLFLLYGAHPLPILTFGITLFAFGAGGFWLSRRLRTNIPA